MMIWMLLLGLLGQDAAAAAPAPQQPLNLVCLGRGSANKQQASGVFAQASDGSSGWAQMTSERAIPFEDQADLRLFAGDDRIRLPRKLLPPIHGGEGGWFKLKNLNVTPREITASVAINFINAPKLRIDRHTGSISIAGKAGDYFGECEAFREDSSKPRF